MKQYKQLNQEDRALISGFLKSGMSKRAIAKKMKRSPSTISRETKRNKGHRGYRPKQAHAYAIKRKQKPRRPKRLDAKLKQTIRYYLKNEQWSPDQISHSLKKKKGISVSIQTIYSFIKEDEKNGGLLKTHLRHSRKRRKPYGSIEKRGMIKNKTSIHERPPEVEAKTTADHWEIDLISGENHKGFIVTAVERKTKFLVMKMIPNKSSVATSKAIIEMLKPYRKQVQTITSDNGKEFAGHEKIADKLDAKFYFADPYSSWQRGLNENTNGLVRQYFEKKSSFAEISVKMVTKVARKLNRRPRKGLNYETPNDLFRAAIQKSDGVALVV